MSAFVVSKHDIDILVTACAALRPELERDLTELGRDLWRENVASVAYRYGRLPRNRARL